MERMTHLPMGTPTNEFELDPQILEHQMEIEPGEDGGHLAPTEEPAEIHHPRTSASREIKAHIGKRETARCRREPARYPKGALGMAEEETGEHDTKVKRLCLPIPRSDDLQRRFR